MSSPSFPMPDSRAPRPSGPPPPDHPGPAEALAELLAGNQRFVTGRPRHGHDVSAAAASAALGEQYPIAFVLGCIDSRVPLEAIFDQNFGSICVGRSGAQVLDQAIIGSIEFAVGALGVPLVIVLGHERCGAVASTISAQRTGSRPTGSIGYLVEQIAPAVTEVGVGHPDVQPLAVRAHVRRTVQRLRQVELLAAALADGRIDVTGGVYDLGNGQVELLN
ncbi:MULTISPECIES: carbonic anhydrase [unclassified Solwaraspora]|uniref:carbonic anhydrase n=1 Tax=unclassified Solwaraspora TaxID=2627926 RepID=UPI00248D1C8D|nr:MULTISPECIES: carbonic anhydrase [unclassified Solwaraspora]WBB95302.1 carbonic anhydrase [Solwaraspora sp. WMMA2059]WBC20793.1 carbonic anhydrase [Solwaraspora sp. WMMA2080]WJK37073.1 carbonic anhydrase [Solwaraspora sp. WMMA2065]